MLEEQLSRLPRLFKGARIPSPVWVEAKKRILDSLACFYGAFHAKPNRILRDTFLRGRTGGEGMVWGTSRKVSAELAAWVNGTAVRTLDYNDTYLSKEPCHPSDLLSTLWAACEVSGSRRQGKLLLEAMILGYETVCRLCDAHSLRLRGWDHVNYIGMASAVACSHVFRLSPEKTRHAIALTVVANNAMRQTRVGAISDWKASCAAYAAKAGLAASRLAAHGFTGPGDIFSGRHGFFHQVSGAFSLPRGPLGPSWKMMETHTKFFPAEHHAQSAIEAAIALSSAVKGRRIKQVTVDSFDASVDIIGSEKEKWTPETRETADHSLPYLVCAALLEADICLDQYEKKFFLASRVRKLMRRTRIKRNARYTSMYPVFLPARVTVSLESGEMFGHEVLRPKGYARRPMTTEEIVDKFDRLSAPLLSGSHRRTLRNKILQLERVPDLRSLAATLQVSS